MSKYIDADNLHNAKFQSISGYGENVTYRVGWNDAIDAICENEPSIDIVRCKECKYCVPYSTCGGDWQKCMRNIESLHDVYLNDFCSYGDKRDD